MSFKVIQETDFTAYRCCVCGDRVRVDDAEIEYSSVCFQCSRDILSIAFIPIPMTEWEGSFNAEQPVVKVRPKVGTWR